MEWFLDRSNDDWLARAVESSQCRVTVVVRPAPVAGDHHVHGLGPHDVVGDGREPPWQQPAPAPSHTTDRHGPNPLDALSGRELDVLRLASRAMSNQGIADALFVSKSAVEKHLQGIFRKLGLRPHRDLDRRVRAVLLFQDWGGGTGEDRAS